MTDTPEAPLLLVRDARAGRESLESYRSRRGYEALERALKSLSPAQVLDEVDASGLRGCGGAAFPVGRKWRLAAGAEAGERYVVANGGEHEPGSLKDRHLMSNYPHTVLEGVALAAYATGASVAYIYLIEDMQDAICSLKEAIAEAEGAGFIGPAQCGSSHALEVRIHLAPTTYVAGEETAALSSIEGEPAKPREKPPYPGEVGVFGKPTTVNNVETMARVPGIILHGASWHRSIGVPDSPGTMIFTLDSKVKNPGLHELSYGATFRDLIEGCGGGLAGGAELRAILPAMSSAFLLASAIDTPLTHTGLSDAGSSLGCGGVHLITTDDVLIDRVLEIAEFFMREQCGLCPPCRMETSTLVAILKKVKEGVEGAHLAQMEKIANFTRGKGRCSLIEMAAAPVLSAARLFPEELGISAGS